MQTRTASVLVAPLGFPALLASTSPSESSPPAGKRKTPEAMRVPKSSTGELAKIGAQSWSVALHQQHSHELRTNAQRKTLEPCYRQLHDILSLVLDIHQTWASLQGVFYVKTETIIVRRYCLSFR